jgi:KDO2-lipid IV(A) lauroyltransferase
MREMIEFWLVKGISWILGLIPRRLACFVSDGLAWLVFTLFGRLRRVGRRNLEMAFPSLSPEARQAILKGVYRSLGRQLVEFCRMSRYTPANTERWIRTEGLFNYTAARDRGKGVLVLTGHLGAWELSSFYHSLMGHPMGMVIRRLDNRHLDAYVNSIRCMYGNKVLHKDDFARGLLTAMHKGETVGILMDTNMTPPQGAFAKFFGKEACTGTGLARVALKTGATVLPGFMVWEAEEHKFVLHFGPPIEFEVTGDLEADVLAATQQCNDVLEAWIRRYPDQWLWIHRRWKTRPAGQPALYSGKHGAISGSYPAAGDSK